MKWWQQLKSFLVKKRYNHCMPTSRRCCKALAGGEHQTALAEHNLENVHVHSNSRRLTLAVPWNNGCFSPPPFLIFPFYSFLKFQFPSKNVLLSKCKDTSDPDCSSSLWSALGRMLLICVSRPFAQTPAHGRCRGPSCCITERMMFSLSYDAFYLRKPYLLGKTSSLTPHSQQHMRRTLSPYVPSDP